MGEKHMYAWATAVKSIVLLEDSYEKTCDVFLSVIPIFLENIFSNWTTFHKICIDCGLY